jgi:hypothetical protein
MMPLFLPVRRANYAIFLDWMRGLFHLSYAGPLSAIILLSFVFADVTPLRRHLFSKIPGNYLSLGYKAFAAHAFHDFP